MLATRFFRLALVVYLSRIANQLMKLCLRIDCKNQTSLCSGTLFCLSLSQCHVLPVLKVSDLDGNQIRESFTPSFG
ncbi:hypothetical protein SLEP1_g15048 [Rubroshorea leprosula]|uniref:Secreted protein n=1 Tax=Rubroshorea leprosula TaxID=152421 RepID=A0AAV5IVL7_9ROSI|nr:hypothetical protein SLEP1_g15048 [Rubroshorea leprosula]